MIHDQSHHNGKNQTARARGQLYVLITQFRKEAQQSSNSEISTIFAMSAEVMAGLARSFREYEGRASNEEIRDDNPSDCSPNAPV
jgi:hypothetical protein